MPNFENMPNIPKTGSPEWKAKREAEAKARNEERRTGKNTPVPDFAAEAQAEKASFQEHEEASRRIALRDALRPDIEAEKAKLARAAEKEKTRANIADLRAKLGIKDLKTRREEERRAKVHEAISADIDAAIAEDEIAQNLKEIRAMDNERARPEQMAKIFEKASEEINRDNDRKDVRNMLKEMQEAERGVDVDLSDIEEEPAPKRKYDVSPAEADEMLLQERLRIIKSKNIPMFSEGRHKDLETRRDELTDEINNNVKKGLWNSIKLWGKRRELNQVIEQSDMSLDHYADLRRDLAAAERDLARLMEDQLVSPAAKLRKKLLEAEIKKHQKELAPFEKLIKRAYETK